jgi:hypothetical protein
MVARNHCTACYKGSPFIKPIDKPRLITQALDAQIQKHLPPHRPRSCNPDYSTISQRLGSSRYRPVTAKRDCATLDVADQWRQPLAVIRAHRSPQRLLSISANTLIAPSGSAPTGVSTPALSNNASKMRGFLRLSLPRPNVWITECLKFERLRYSDSGYDEKLFDERRARISKRRPAIWGGEAG